MNRILVLPASLLVLTVAGCGGGGGGSSPTAAAAPAQGTASTTSSAPAPAPTPAPPPATRVTPVGQTDPLRPDLLSGQSLASVSLQDRREHVFRFPGIPGTSYRFSIDTQPSGRELDVQVVEENGGRSRFSGTVRTPYTGAVSASADVALELRVFDPYQASLTLSRLSVTPAAPSPWDPGKFQVVLHVCGDSFAGLGMFNDLATAQDQSSFAGALLDRLNTILPSDVQVDVAASGIRRLSVADVSGVAPALVAGGRTLLPVSTQDVGGITRLGIPSTNATFGRALDVFLCQEANPQFPTTTGQCECNDVGQGGVFLGTGPEHAVFLRLFEPNGLGRTLAALANTLAHELGHFLSLFHTTEASLLVDDIPDSPFSSRAHDLNGNGRLDSNEDTGPDAGHVMFPYAGQKTLWSMGQRAAMRAYLSLREH
jgi:hypothetical protein